MGRAARGDSVANVMLSPHECAEVLRALGDETRLKILESLLLEEKCVTDLVREMRRTQPHVSHHLRVLRAAGLVEGLREGKRICYRVSPKIQGALKEHHRQALDFGCCRISFPDSELIPLGRSSERRAIRGEDRGAGRGAGGVR